MYDPISKTLMCTWVNALDICNDNDQIYIQAEKKILGRNFVMLTRVTSNFVFFFPIFYGNVITKDYELKIILFIHLIYTYRVS